jgi:PAS domain S-box-containing protein
MPDVSNDDSATAERARMEKAFRLDESRLEALLKLNQLTGASAQEIINFALEEAVALTESRIGYLAFMNEDESVLTMHAWSKTAMAECAIVDKPIVYPIETTGLWGEAVRQRQPVITNNYAASNPLKKGHPDGHVPVLRHMNIPVFDGDLIVAVAGVGNKPEDYDESDVRQLDLLMEGMWRLLQRIRTEEELRDHREHLEELVEKRAADLRVTNERLEREVQERKRAEVSLAHERDLLTALMNTIPDHIYFKDMDSHFLRVSRAMAQYFDLADPSDAVGKSDFDFFGPEHAQQAYDDEQKVIQADEPVVGKEEREDWPDGRVTWVSSTKVPLRDGDDRIIGTFGISRDITARREAEDALRDSEERHRLLLDTMNEGFTMIDADATFTYVNGTFCKMLGGSREAIVGRPVLDFFDEENRRLVAAQIEARRASASASTPYEAQWRGIDGRRIATIISPKAIRDEAGTYQGSFAVITNVDELKRTQKRLEVALADVARSNEELEQFAYVASHDLQEPLRMVSSFTQLLSRRYSGRLDDKADEYIEFAVDGAKRMQRLIIDLLTYSRVTTTANPPRPTNCESVLAQVIDNLKVAIDESGATVTHDRLPTVPGDETQLLQLFQNLIGNAIKFHGDEAPAVHVSATAANGVWRFAVADNGIGIGADYLERVFVIFQRTHGQQNYPGTGIGLAVCRKIVERHGGKIWAESQLGKGAVFHFTLQG